MEVRTRYLDLNYVGMVVEDTTGAAMWMAGELGCISWRTAMCCSGSCG